jgi:hypothetical protein
MCTINNSSRVALAAGYALIVLLPCILIVLARAASAGSSRRDVHGLRLCVVAHLLLGPLAAWGHRLSFSGDFRCLSCRRRGPAVATPIIERQPDDVVLRVLEAGDSGLRSGVPRLRDSCRLADDAQLGIILWMRETPPNRARCSEPGHRALVAIHAARGPGRWAWVVDGERV